MRCPSCQHPDSRVIDSRIVREGSAVRRRRECDECGHRFTTYEQVQLEDAQLTVIKKDGTRQPFDTAKIRRGILAACKKRDVDDEIVTELVDRVVAKIHGSGDQEIPAVRIGHAVAEGLREIDDVAYVRFMSVYQRFEDTGEFRKALDSLAGRPSGDGE